MDLNALRFEIGLYTKAVKATKKDEKPPHILQYITLKDPVMVQAASVKKPERATIWVYRDGAWRQKRYYCAIMERDCKAIIESIAKTGITPPMRWPKLAQLVWEDIVYAGPDSHEFKPFDFDKWQHQRKIPVFFPGRVAIIDYDSGCIEWVDNDPKMGNLWTVAVPPQKIPTPVFDEWLDFVTGGDKELQQLLLRIAGACLTPLHMEGFYVFLRGEGKTGKTTFQKIVKMIVGVHNATHLALEAIDIRSKEKLANALVNLPSESAGGGKPLNIEVAMRGIASGEETSCDPKFRDSYDIVPVAKNLFALNKMPILTDSTDGTWRRLIIVPFDRHIQKADAYFAGRLLPELPGISWKMLMGLQELVRAGGDFENILPPVARRLKDKYRTECDHVLGFFSEVLDDDNCDDRYEQLSLAESGSPSPQGEQYALEAPRRKWHQAYCLWCSQTNRKPYGEREFVERMGSREFTERSFGVYEFRRHKTQIVRVWRKKQLIDYDWTEVIPFHQKELPILKSTDPRQVKFTIVPYNDCRHCVQWVDSVCTVGHSCPQSGDCEDFVFRQTLQATC